MAETQEVETLILMRFRVDGTDSDDPLDWEHLWRPSVVRLGFFGDRMLFDTLGSGGLHDSPAAASIEGQELFNKLKTQGVVNV